MQSAGPVSASRKADQVAAQLFQRAFRLAQLGFAVTAQVAGVGGEVAQSALDVRPAVPVLREAMEHDCRRALSQACVADGDVCEPDSHATSPGPAPSPLTIARRSALRIFPAGVIGIASTIRRTSGQ